MERSIIISISVLVLGCVVTSAAAQNVSYLNAYPAYYGAEENQWDMDAVHVYCATWDADKSLKWRSKYNWTAFGSHNSEDPHGQDACGKCLNVTYVGETATVFTTLRIVDTCDNCLEVDSPAFDQLDIDGLGSVIGHLNVSYTFVDCGDADQNVSYLNAYPAYYKAEENNWDMNAVHVYCATWDADKSLEWRSKYNWTAFGSHNSEDPHGQDACGKCLNVTYVSTETKETAAATVRIVDTCDNCLELDKPVFDQLDIDGSASEIGHLNVSYTFVDCDDAEIRLYSSQ